MTDDSPRLRLSILGIVALALFSALFARLWFLQVVGSPEYQLQAELMSTREINIEAPRGRILDAKGRVVVDNRVSTVVTLDRKALDAQPERDQALLRLAQELTEAGLPTKVSDLEARMVDPRFSPIEPVPVAVDISEELEVFLIERQDEFPGVAVERETVRTYPYGDVAAHVLGYVGKINEEELVERMGTDDDPIDNPKPYQEDDHVGKSGVEDIFEEELRGTPGVRTVEVDARGEILRTLDYTPPIPGNDIELTIDLDVQMLTERELLDGMEAARARPAKDGRPTHSPAGSAVVLDPQTGGVIAMASYPTYNPEEFVNGITTERYEELKAQGDPFTNRAIAGQYAPGSTFKLITAYAGLNTGLISPNDSYNDPGFYEIANCGAGNCRPRSSAGRLGGVNVTRALTYSSDTFFYWLADRYWRARDTWGEAPIQETARQFGLGADTQVPLPSEQSGVIPDPQQRRKQHEENPEAFPNEQWYVGDNINMSIGQGDVLVTPVQLANAYGTFVNGGTLYNPNIVKRVLAPDSDPADPEVVRDVEPRILNELDTPEPIYRALMAGFDGVTKQGTARAAFAGFDQSLWSVGGKTGTAEVDNKADSSVFVGFGPLSDIHYVAAVIIEEGGFGGDTAAPVVRRIFEPLASVYPLPSAMTLAEQAAAPPPAEEEGIDDLIASGGGAND